MQNFCNFFVLHVTTSLEALIAAAIHFARQSSCLRPSIRQNPFTTSFAAALPRTTWRLNCNDDKPFTWMRTVPIHQKITAVLKVTALCAVRGLVKCCLAAALTVSTLSHRANLFGLGRIFVQLTYKSVTEHDASSIDIPLSNTHIDHRLLE